MHHLAYFPSFKVHSSLCEHSMGATQSATQAMYSGGMLEPRPFLSKSKQASMKENNNNTPDVFKGVGKENIGSAKHRVHGIWKTDIDNKGVSQSDLGSKDHYFRVVNLEAKIDNRPTTIDESSSTVLKYKTPHFRASATVQIPPLESGEEWQIGWIQACTYMKFINTYGREGCSCWEFPELTSGRYQMISDSDGRHYPWYGNKTEVATTQGPTNMYQTVTVTMNDNFYPHITWVIPMEGEVRPKLTHVVRDQTFYTWLVTRNLNTNDYYILKTTSWKMHLEIVVDPTRPLGQRAKLVAPWQQEAPVILDNQVAIAGNAMKPPNANSAQTLIWKPARGGAFKVIVPPKWPARRQAQRG